jgi:hypothetical protein
MLHRSSPGLILLFAALTLAGCGDDATTVADAHPDAEIPIDGSPIDGSPIDSSIIDSGPDAPIDAGDGIDAPPIDGSTPDSPTRWGRILVAEVAVTSPDANIPVSSGGPGGIAGQSISITFDDLTTGGVTPAYADPGIPATGCTVSVYTVGTDIEHPLVDEGALYIGPQENGPSGIISPNGDPMPETPCVFSLDSHVYGCIAGVDGPTTATVTSNGNGTATYTIADLAPRDRKGQFLEIGFFDDSPNSGWFPVVASAGNAITVVNPGAVNTTSPQQMGYAFRLGYGPVPLRGGTIDFLTDGGENKPEAVRIQKDAGNTLPAFDVTLRPEGEGMTLAGTQPHTLPLDGSAATFSCAAGDCGPAFEPISGLYVSGRTTSAPVPAHPDYLMPPTEAMKDGQQYAVFECFFIGQTSATISADAMSVILGTNPTRIETRVVQIGGSFQISGLNRTTIGIGHGFVGHTTIP